MQKIFLSIPLIIMIMLTACGAVGNTESSDNTDPYGESVVAVSGYSCVATDGVAVATVSMTTTESVNPVAYIEIASTTVLESQITLTAQEGNCTSSTTSYTPICVYTFTWQQATAPLQTLYFQLNGSPGPYFLTTMNVGGPICSSS